MADQKKLLIEKLIVYSGYLGNIGQHQNDNVLCFIAKVESLLQGIFILYCVADDL